MNTDNPSASGEPPHLAVLGDLTVVGTTKAEVDMTIDLTLPSA